MFIPPKAPLGKMDPERDYLPLLPSSCGGEARHASPIHINDAQRIVADYNRFAQTWNGLELDNLQGFNWREGRLANNFRSVWGDVCWNGRFRDALGWSDYITERRCVIRFQGFSGYDLHTGLRRLVHWNNIGSAGWLN